MVKKGETGKTVCLAEQQHFPHLTGTAVYKLN